MVEPLSTGLEKYESRKKNPELPLIIQGGMGVWISSSHLARTVAQTSEEIGIPMLGVTSLTGIGIIFSHRLQDGDEAALELLNQFPIPEIRDQVLREWGADVVKPAGYRYKPTPRLSDFSHPNKERRNSAIYLTLVASNAAVWEAKQGHSGKIGLNLLEKIQIPHLVELYGAMLAGVDDVIMGAGIPLQIPGILDSFSENRPASYKLDVAKATREYRMGFDPAEFIPPSYLKELKRPDFLAVVSYNLVAKLLATKASGYVNGFIIEGHTAGGHNANPRGKLIRDEAGEPIYGEKDKIDLDQIKELGRPFWLAGSYASPQKLQEALRLGAVGVQVGTIFECSDESGLREKDKASLKKAAFNGTLQVKAASTSPTGFLFQEALLAGTIADPAVYEKRPRNCSIGYLVTPYEISPGTLGHRCASEPIKAYVAKGGDAKDAEGMHCICNGLIAGSGFGLAADYGRKEEPSVVTAGKDFSFIPHLLKHEDDSYTVKDAALYMLQDFLPTPNF